MSRVELPSGAWVRLRDPSDLRVSDRKMVVRAGVGIDAGLDRNLAFAEARIVVAVAEWSDEKHPTIDDLTAFDDMHPGDYVALDVLTGPHDDALFPNFTPAGASDPKAPSVTSNVSDGG